MENFPAMNDIENNKELAGPLIPGTSDEDSGSESFDEEPLLPPKKPKAVAAIKKNKAATKKPAIDVGPAPKRFKSSFIFFSMEKHKELKETMNIAGEGAVRAANITKMVSEAWRTMPDEQRAIYQEMARKDKMRYDKDIANYGGPTKKKRTGGSQKERDPDCPKRPMSAYLVFANARRSEVKKSHPEFSNGEISKLLSQMWKDADDDTRKPLQEQEIAQWEEYKEKIVEYRKKNDGRKKKNKGNKHSSLKKTASPAAKKKKLVKNKKPRNDGTADDELYDNIMPTAGFDDQHVNGFNNSNMSQDDFIAATALRGVRGSGQPGFNLNIGNLGTSNDLTAKLLQLQQQQEMIEQQSGLFQPVNNMNVNPLNPLPASGLGGGSQNAPSMLDMGLLGGLSGLGASGLSGLGGGNGLSGGMNMNFNALAAGLGGSSQGSLSQNLGLNMGMYGRSDSLGLGNSTLSNTGGLNSNTSGFGGSNGISNSMLAALRNNAGTNNNNNLLYGLGGGGSDNTQQLSQLASLGQGGVSQNFNNMNFGYSGMFNYDNGGGQNDESGGVGTGYSV